MGKTYRAYATRKENKAEKAAATAAKPPANQGPRRINALGFEINEQEQPDNDTESENDDDSGYESVTPATMFSFHQLAAQSDFTDARVQSDSTDLAIQNAQEFAHHFRKGKNLSKKSLSTRVGRHAIS